MKTFTRREYNLVVKCLEYYPLMKEDEKKLSEIIQDKLYYFNVDKVTETNNNSLELPDLSNNLDNKPVIENGQYIPF